MCWGGGASGAKTRTRGQGGEVSGIGETGMGLGQGGEDFGPEVWGGIRRGATGVPEMGLVCEVS